MIPRALRWVFVLLAHASGILPAARAASHHHNVPVSILLSVGVYETTLGTGRRDGRVWPHRGALDAQADSAALSLRHGYTRCGSWVGALQRYHLGSCALQNCPPGHHPHAHPYAVMVLRYARALAPHLHSRRAP